MNTKQIGDYGENAAAAYLEYKGYEIVKRNYRIRNGEIDIIARDTNGTLVFAEVKTRSRTDYGLAAEYVDAKKRERLIRTALIFTGRDDIDMRFDVVEVYYSVENGGIKLTRINHIKNAFGG
ncbi:MAG: YraN family protein [Clostridia bacterium]|nr:YraN family protein [Clostridia bacterium]